MELLIMAAGMGSRFGGLKQLASMGPNDEFIIDYSVFDAIKAGFSKIVFIIKEENFEIFKETIGKRVEPHIPVEYVFQKLDMVPSFVKVPEDRVKPWGTAQAIYCAKDAINGDFLVINSDDFYGRDAFLVAKDFANNKKDKCYGLIGYEASKTLTENGTVKRGVLKVDQDDNLEELIESSVYLDGEEIECEPLSGDPSFRIRKDSLVSMNMMVLDKSIFTYLEKDMELFFKKNEDNLLDAEYLIPDVLSQVKEEGYVEVKVLHTTARWYGVTYKEDTDGVRKALLELTNSGEYPKNLWK